MSPSIPETSRLPTAFPEAAYAHYILKPAFDDARRLLFAPMLRANDAHLVMLARQGIVSRQSAGRALAALRDIAAQGPAAFAYAPPVEDLFFAVEGELIARAGADDGGNLQIARSRNDLDAVMCRLMLRDLVLRTVDETVALRERLIHFAREHVDTLMAGTTHTQPAQPTTLAHYLGGVLGPLQRDTARLWALYALVNQNPLGAAAFTTTGFPIDRDFTAALLGFSGVVENSYDAVGASDHMMEATSTLATLVSSLSRFVHDLLIWARPDIGAIRIGDEFVQISSIMPQKRNPVVLEHIRARIGYVYGDANTVATMVHSSAFGDTVDIEDEIYVPLARAFEATSSVLTLLDRVFATMTIDRELLAARAARHFTTATELADALVRHCDLPFRVAHAITSRVVTTAVANGVDVAGIGAEQVESAAEAVISRRLGLDEDFVRAALDPAAFVAVRTVPGGPAPAAMRDSLERLEDARLADTTRLREERARLAGAGQLLADEVTALVTGR